jgi:hypothetical protein
VEDLRDIADHAVAPAQYALISPYPGAIEDLS